MNRLSDEEKLFFDKLTKDREDSAKTLAKPSMKGVERAVVEKYSDQAHFIYELLQNADDAKATQAKFILKDHGLLFIHNGSIHFSISDPEKEEEDKKANRLGHINSITSIANSAKNEASIGKFGVGFKAVFQYTDTPHIYDPRFEFKIDRFIVPKLIENDIRIDIIRSETDTTFYFPFDKLDLTREKAYSEIYEKLRSLIFPILFLSDLNEVSWTADITNGKYYKKRKMVESRDNIKIELFDIFREYFGAKSHEEQLWLFSRQLDQENHTYSIGFFLDKDNKLKSVDHPAFCFFPTKEKTGLKFIVHAPFLLTDNREGIKAGEEWNQDLIMKLADLGAESLLILRDKNLINDGIVEIIPYKETEFKKEDNFDSISFRPFYDSIKNILQNEELLPTKDEKYTKRTHAYWADSTELCELFPNSQLSKLVGDSDAKWVFTSIGRTKDTDLTQYIDGGDDRINRKPHLITANYTPEKILNVITADFIQCQPFPWLNQLYEYLLERKSYRDSVKNKPIFIDTNGNAISAFDKNNQLKLFLPTEENSEYTTIHKDFLKNDTSMKFFETFGIKEPSLEDEIYNKILPLYDSDKEIDTTQHFRKFFNYYKLCPNLEISSYVNSIKNKKIIIYNVNKKSFKFRGFPDDIYYPTPELLCYFEGKPEAKFLDIKFYQNLIDESEHETLEKFFKKLGISKYPRIFEMLVSAWQINFPYNAQYLYDKTMDGCEEVFQNITKQRAITLWEILVLMIKENGNTDFLNGIHRAGKWERFDSSLLKRLKNEKWLVTKDNSFEKPEKVNIDELALEFEKDNEYAKKLINILGFCNLLIDSVYNDLSERDRKLIDIGKKFESFSDEEINKVLDSLKKRRQNEEKNEENRADDSAIFPQKPMNNPEQRNDFMAEKYANSEEKQYEKVERVIRKSSPLIEEKRSYLEYWYTNDAEKMFCQICKEEMPFKKPSGKYYFEIREISINTKSEESEITRETIEPYLALCPICAAKYKVFVQTNPEKMSDICTKIKEIPHPTNDENTDIPILLDNEQIITFVAPHLSDLQAILRMESK